MRPEQRPGGSKPSRATASHPGRRWLAVLAMVGLVALVVVSTTGGFSGGPPEVHPKRGVASRQYLTGDPSKLSALGAVWVYNWRPYAPRTTAGLEWVPMLWGPKLVTPAAIASLQSDERTGRAHYLLGFNEPDSVTQANMTPSQAARLWPELEQTGLTLGSPAPATPTDGWLARFMTLVRRRHLRVDFIALHYYQDFTNPASVDALRQQLIEIHAAYHRPIWITEIGAIDQRGWGVPMMRTPSPTVAAGYMRKVFPMLDALPFVKRYAWFTDDCWRELDCRTTSLFNGQGELTAPGQAFKTAS